MSNSYLIKLVDNLSMYKGNSIEGKMRCSLAEMPPREEIEEDPYEGAFSD